MTATIASVHPVDERLRASKLTALSLQHMLVMYAGAVAVPLGLSMIPLIAPNFKQWMPHSIHQLIESGIPLAAITAAHQTEAH